MSVYRRILAIGLASLLALAAAACAGGGAPKPPEIAYGRDVCEMCGMLISEARFAAAVLLEDGRALKFDDAGEMFAYHHEHPDLKARAWFVHDYRTEEWTRGEQAFYVISQAVRSPMGTGVAAFSERPAAEAFAHGAGADVLTFEQAVAAVNEGGQPMQGH
jgi:copper chaperone NosL